MRGGEPDTPAASLSGGNQQKVVIARELAEEPRVLVAAQPTRGLDVGAIEFVHRRLLEQRDAGRAVLLVSLELEEIRSLADRVLVIYEGRIVGEFPPDATDEELGRRHDRRRRGRRASRRHEPTRRSAAPARARGAVTVASRLSRLHARRRHPRPADDGAARVRRRRPRRARHGRQPVDTYKAIFDGTRAELAVPVDHRRRPHARGAEPPADAAPHRRR